MEKLILEHTWRDNDKTGETVEHDHSSGAKTTTREQHL
jgi:hypothetical protein